MNMDREAVRIVLDSAAVLIAVVVFFVLLFGLGGVEAHDPLTAATVSAVIGATIAGAAELARSKVYSHATVETQRNLDRLDGPVNSDR